jgi:hypothetical protein
MGAYRIAPLRTFAAHRIKPRSLRAAAELPTRSGHVRDQAMQTRMNAHPAPLLLKTVLPGLGSGRIPLGRPSALRAP